MWTDQQLRELTNQDLDELMADARDDRMPSPLMFARLIHTARRRGRHLPSVAEVFAVGAAPLPDDPDTMKIWILDPEGTPWTSEPILDDSDSELEARLLVDSYDAYDEDRGVLHQTAVRTVITDFGRFRCDTFMAVVPLDGRILQRWPRAEAITQRLLNTWGPPPPHDPMEPARFHTGHSLMHGLGHLAERMGEHGDRRITTRLENLKMGGPLGKFEKTLFTQFQTEDRRSDPAA